jgi:hypothetical protein
LSCFVPVSRAYQIARPKGPHPALTWPNRINHTFFLAAFFSQKYAIFRTGLFNNRRSQANSSEIFLPQLSGCHFQKVCNYLNFRPANPDIALGWPRAAPSALQTLKMQTVDVPRTFFNHGFHGRRPERTRGTY